MASAITKPIKDGGSISIFEDDRMETPFAIQISHDLAVLSVRMTVEEFVDFHAHVKSTFQMWLERTEPVE